MDTERMIIKDGHLSTLWNSMEEFKKEGVPLIERCNGALYRHCIVNRVFVKHRWYGGPISGKEAMEKVDGCWPEMHAKMLSMWGDEKPQLALETSHLHLRRRKRKRADHGDTLDMHRVWSGELDKAWERPERQDRLSVSMKHATIFIDNCMNVEQDATEALWRSATATLICDLLIMQGRAVEIFVGNSNYNLYNMRGAPMFVWTCVRVKAYNEPLHAEKLTAMVTPAFQRTYGWMLKLATPYPVHDNLGYPRNAGLPLQLKRRQDAGELVVRIGECYSRMQAEMEFYKVAGLLAKENVDDSH